MTSLKNYNTRFLKLFITTIDYQAKVGELDRASSASSLNYTQNKSHLRTCRRYGESTFDASQPFAFFEDDDPTRTRMRLAIGALQQLIKLDGVTELEPYLKELVEVLIEKAVKA